MRKYTRRWFTGAVLSLPVVGTVAALLKPKRKAPDVVYLVEGRGLVLDYDVSQDGRKVVVNVYEGGNVTITGGAVDTLNVLGGNVCSHAAGVPTIQKLEAAIGGDSAHA